MNLIDLTADPITVVRSENGWDEEVDPSLPESVRSLLSGAESRPCDGGCGATFGYVDRVWVDQYDREREDMVWSGGYALVGQPTLLLCEDCTPHWWDPQHGFFWYPDPVWWGR